MEIHARLACSRFNAMFDAKESLLHVGSVAIKVHTGLSAACHAEVLCLKGLA